MSLGQLTLSDTSGTEAITGPAAGVTVNADGLSRVFEVDAGVAAAISGLTISGGSASEWGGGLAIYGTATLSDCTISGNTGGSNWGGGGLVNDGSGAVTLTDCTLTNNYGGATGSGGAIENEVAGTVTLTECTVSGNTGYRGGAISNYSMTGTVELLDCTVSGNTATYTGGGGIENRGTLTLTDCTVADNRAAKGGGGVYNEEQPSEKVGGSATLTNCTVSGNSATGGSGGGVQNLVGTISLTNCTISDNVASASGGGVAVTATNTLTIGNSIVAGNTATTSDPDVIGAFTSQGHNLIGKTDGSTGWVGSDLTGTIASPLNALMVPLANYGGPTETMALLPGSPAIDAGNNALIPSGVTTDERGLPRIVGGTVDIGAFESSGFTIAVVSGSGQSATITEPFASPLVASVTANNANEPIAGGQIIFTGPGAGPSISPSVNFATIAADGTASVTITANIAVGTYTVTAAASKESSTAFFSLTNLGSLIVNTTSDALAPGPGLTTLRMAIDDANSLSSGSAAIIFDPTVFATPQTITLTSGQLTLSNTTLTETIFGPAAGLTISGGGLSRVFEVNSGVTASISRLTITGGSTSGNGGGLYNLGTTTLTDVTVSGNSAPNTSTYGDGIYNSGAITLTDCTVSGNSGWHSGGLQNSASGTAILTDCTVSSNTVITDAGGISNLGTMTVSNSTFTGDTAGGAVDAGCRAE